MDKYIDVNNITLYRHRQKILDDVSFSIAKGEVWGLVGPNGAGKTTIMKTMLGITKFDQGHIKIDGEQVSSYQHRVVRKQVGALIENPSLYPYLTGMQHLKLFSDSNRNISDIIQQLDMDKFIYKKTRQYSLGMKQKLGIALALVNCPKFVILDEPMNGLDPHSIQNLRLLINKRNVEDGTTFLISSHVLSELQKIVHGIITVSSGKVDFKMTLANLMDTQPRDFVIHTNDDKRAIKILYNKLLVSDKNPLRFNEFSPVNVNDRLRVLIDSGICIDTVTSNNLDLEDSLAKILDDKQEKRL